MIENELILRKNRTFGEIISDTFHFIKENIHIILQAFIIVFMPIYSVVGVLAIIIALSLSDMFYEYEQAIESSILDGDPILLFSFLGNYIPIFIFISLLLLLVTAVSYSIIYSIMHQYDEKGKDQIEISEVWKDTRKFIVPIILYYFLSFFITGFGFLFLVIPGIILAIMLTMAIPSIIFERKDAISAIGRCFQIFDFGSWFATFGLMIVFGIIGTILGYIANIPYVIAFLMTQILDVNIWDISNSTLSVGMAIYYFFNYLFSFLIGIISTIGIGLQFFNLVEDVDHTGIRRVIDQIGTDE